MTWKPCSNYPRIYTVHDTENFFPRNSAIVPRGTTRNFRAGAAELPRGRRGTSARADADSARVDADLPSDSG